MKLNDVAFGALFGSTVMAGAAAFLIGRNAERVDAALDVLRNGAPQERLAGDNNDIGCEGIDAEIEKIQATLGVFQNRAKTCAKAREAVSDVEKTPQKIFQELQDYYQEKRLVDPVHFRQLLEGHSYDALHGYLVAMLKKYPDFAGKDIQIKSLNDHLKTGAPDVDYREEPYERSFYQDDVEIAELFSGHDGKILFFVNQPGRENNFLETLTMDLHVAENFIHGLSRPDASGGDNKFHLESRQNRGGRVDEERYLLNKVTGRYQSVDIEDGKIVSSNDD